MVFKIILWTCKKHALKLMGESQHDMYALKTMPKNLWEKWHMYTVFLKVVVLNGSIKMKNFYLDLLHRLTIGAFTRYVTFEKRWDPEATWPFTDSTFRTCRS